MSNANQVPSVRLRHEHVPTPVPITARIRAAKDLAELEKLIDLTFTMTPSNKTKRAWDEAIKARRLQLIREAPAS
jgi:hypothetical protein